MFSTLYATDEMKETFMSSLFCPRCAVPQPMNRSTTEQEITGPGGAIIKLVTESCHCAICYSFVRSESVHERNEGVAA